MRLVGPRAVLRTALAGDVDAITGVLGEPEVARWWGPYPRERVADELAGFTIVVGEEVVGWLLFEAEEDPQFRHVRFDIALSSRLHGLGYGTEALRLVIGHFIERGHHRFTIDPAADNATAIRAYAAVGFKSVGLLRDYELTTDGEFRDGLLMDLLAAEFRDESSAPR